MKNTLMFLTSLSVLFTLQSCNKKRLIREIQIVHSTKARGSMSGSIEVGDVTLNRIGVKSNYKPMPGNTNAVVETLKVDPPQEVRKVNYDIVWSVSHDFPEPYGKKEYQVHFSGKVKGKKKVKTNSIRVYGAGLRTKGVRIKGVKCDNVFTLDPEKLDQEGVLKIDISKFHSLDDCEAKATAHYMPSRIQNREMNPDALFGGMFTKFGSIQGFNMAQEVSMGDNFAAELLRKNRGLIIPSTIAKNYLEGRVGDHFPQSSNQAENQMAEDLQDLMNHLVETADIARDPFGLIDDVTPKVYFINSEVPNAMASPGGHVFVFRGLLETAKDLDSVMAVLGHEWAHVVSRHSTEGMSRGALIVVLAQALTGVLKGAINKSGGQKASFVKGVLGLLVDAGAFIGLKQAITGFGRAAESEADLLGAQYAERAGYNTTGIAKMFSRFKEMSAGREQGWLGDLFNPSTHPKHDTRIARNLMYSALFYDYEEDSENQGKKTRLKIPAPWSPVSISGLATLDDLSNFSELNAVVESKHPNFASKFTSSFIENRMSEIAGKIYDDVVVYSDPIEKSIDKEATIAKLEAKQQTAEFQKGKGATSDPEELEEKTPDGIEE